MLISVRGAVPLMVSLSHLKAVSLDITSDTLKNCSF